MSASQALASARRRRVNTPSVSQTIQSSNSGMNVKQSVANKELPPDVPSTSIDSQQNHNEEEVATFQPKPVPEAKTPGQMLRQHSIRLYNLENGISQSMGFIDSNIDILSTGYNNVATNLEKLERSTDSSFSSIERLVSELTDRIAYLESKLSSEETVSNNPVVDDESVDSNESSGSTFEGEEEVTIHFSNNNS